MAKEEDAKPIVDKSPIRNRNCLKKSQSFIKDNKECNAVAKNKNKNLKE